MIQVVITSGVNMNTLSKVPLYFQLIEKFERKIAEGTWTTGMKIPSERDLSEIYDVSRITVRSAVDDLARSGLLQKVQGKGTFVISKNIQQELGNMYGFSNEMKKRGKITHSKVIHKRVIVAGTKIASILGIGENDQVIDLKRLRVLEDGEPILIERSYFAYDKYKFILDQDFNQYSLYDYLENEHQIVFDKAIEKFKVCLLTDKEAERLNAGEHETFGMLIRRVSYIKDSVECYSTLVTKGDIFEFTVKLGN